MGEGKENERAENVTGGHKIIIKTALKSEKCVVCDERIKFGKVSLRCSECKLVMQSECEDKMPLSCSPLSPTMVSNTPGGPHSGGPRDTKQEEAEAAVLRLSDVTLK